MYPNPMPGPNRRGPLLIWVCLALIVAACVWLVLAAASRAAEPSITDRLTASKAAVEVTSVPAGTDHIGVAVMKTLSGEGLKEGIDLPAATRTYTPPAGTPVVDMIARSATGARLGTWAGRLQTVPSKARLEVLEKERSADEAKARQLATELAAMEAALARVQGEIEQVAEEGQEQEPPAEEPVLEEAPHEEPSTFHKGVDGGGWGLSNELADYPKLRGNPSVRLENPGNTGTLTNAGIFVVYLLNHYSSGGVKSINVAGYVKEAEAEAAQNPTDALEVLNEPGGNWFWGAGAESAENAAAYDRLLKAVHEHVHVPVYASFDGGHAGDNTWGRRMLAADPHVVEYVTAFTEHPYDGSGANPSSTLVHWGAVEEAHRLTGKPVAITEYGRPLLASTGDSPRSTEAQQAAADGAMVRKARESGYVLNVEIYGYRGDSSPCYAVFKGNGTPRPAVAAIAGA